MQRFADVLDHRELLGRRLGALHSLVRKESPYQRDQFLAVGRIVERPIAVQGALAVRPVLTLTVTFDHRVVDGARGAEFLDTLAGLVEAPAKVAEEVA